MSISISELEEILKQVDSYKASAEANKDFGDYDEAINDLQHAINLIAPMLERIEAIHCEDIERYQTWLLKLAHELADCYGMQGGNYRRHGNLKKAENAYKNGGDLEIRYKIPETYNRTNVIVLQLLRSPKSHKALEQRIQEARDIVKSQINGKNKNKWWAWADFGLLSLLSVNLKQTEHQSPEETEYQKALYREEAQKAYEKFKDTGAGKQDFESTMIVLQQLKEGFNEVDKITALLMEEEVNYLKENMPER